MLYLNRGEDELEQFGNNLEFIRQIRLKETVIVFMYTHILIMLLHVIHVYNSLYTNFLKNVSKLILMKVQD